MNDIKDLYISMASTLGFKDDVSKVSGEVRKAYVELCANEYIKAKAEGDDYKRDQYISALMLLFWGEVGKMAKWLNGLGQYSYEDYTSKLYECIEVACGYHAWTEGKGSAANCIGQVIASRGIRAGLQEAELDKNKANVSMVSLDATIEDDADSTYVSLVADDDGDSADHVETGAVRLIQNYLDENKVIEAIILDNIAFNDVEKVTRTTEKVLEKSYTTEVNPDTLQATTVVTTNEVKVSQETASFWEYKLVQALNNLPTSYAKYFRGKYLVKANILNEALAKVRSCNNQKLYRYIDATLDAAKAYGSDLRAYMERN